MQNNCIHPNQARNRIRITAQLIEARSDSHLWSETYDRDLEDIFDVQDEVAGAIATAMLGSIDGLGVNPVSRTDSIAAYEAFRTGRLRWWRRSAAEFQKALELFNKAMEYDPGFAPAHAAAADTWLLMILYGNVQILDGIEQAKPLIEKALEIDPDSAEAYAALGLSRSIIGEKEEAEAGLRQAIKLDADYIPASIWLSVLLGNQGRLPEQGEVLQEAIAKDPMNELLTINYSANLHARGDFEGARKMLESLLRYQADSLTLLATLSNISRESGHLIDAWKYAKRAYDLEPENTMVILTMARAWWGIGDAGEGEKFLVTGIEKSRRNVDLKRTYLNLLTVQGRVSEAEDMMRRLFGSDPGNLPEEIQRVYHFQTGILDAVRGNMPAARDHLQKSIHADERQLFDENQIFALTTASMINQAMGDTELAEKQLSRAERVVGHARLNGFDNGEIYYFTACLLALRGEKERALHSLQQAYERGWREDWRLKTDGRIKILNDAAAFLTIQQQVAADIDLARNEIHSIQSSDH